MSAWYGIDQRVNAYQPPVYLSDFWTTTDKFLEINETTKAANLTLNFQVYNQYYFMLTASVGYNDKLYESLGMEKTDSNMLKRMFLESNIYLISVTMVVSLLHTVFEVLAFKNDIQFWNKKDSVEGISIKTLYMNLICEVIILLYLLDNETSYMIYMSMGFAIVLNSWKIV